MPRLLYRLGVFAARHRVLTIVTWAVVLVALGATALGAMRFSTGHFDMPGSESSRALSVVEDDFPEAGAGQSALQLVMQVPVGEEITSEANAERVRQVVAEVAGTNSVTHVSNPLDPAAPYVSEDLRVAVATVTVANLSGDDQAEVYDDLTLAAEDTSTTDLDVLIGGNFGTPVPEIFGITEVVGALLAFLVLFLTFGSLVAAGANMVGALVGVAVGVLGVLAFSAMSPIQQTTPILAVMLGLAVGIDYCLFIIARFRAELRAGREVEDAVGHAIGTAGTSVSFAGLTVIIALAGLAVVNIPFITEMGVAAAVAVLVAVLMALTLLPVFLRSMGHRSLPKRQRATFETSQARAGFRRGESVDTGHRSGFLERWAAFVVRRPLPSILASAAVLLIMAIPILSLQTALNVPGGEDPDSSERAAYNIQAEQFGPGSQSPLIVLVESDGARVQDALPALQTILSGLDDVVRVTPGPLSSNGESALLLVTPDSGPVDKATRALVQDIRDANGEVGGIALAVTGETAIGVDVDSRLSDALVVYIGVIVGLSLLLLVIMFRSILVPLVATAGFLLSLGAGLGAPIAVFQWGWLGPVFAAPQGNPLLSLLPLILTGIIFGLAMDYQVFLVSRMHQAHSRGLSPKEAILDGFARSAPVVVAAALIMAFVFGSFALSPSSFVASIALGLTVGVLADAFVVRMIIVPAVLSLLGRAAWWIPAWLDRILPDFDTEGHALDDDAVERDLSRPAGTGLDSVSVVSGAPR